ncbi:MAG TPA: hypothetical protein VGO91_15825 [Pyrinomonadaceae bacterium]|jgi:hypothetical protein|nr:hypothetical protein [Pyrinomonadaceae bacterium]
MTKAIEKIRGPRADAMSRTGASERGAALITTILILALLAVITMSVMAVVTPEIRIAGSDLQRTQTFYASAASMEKMTSDLSDLFSRTTNPSPSQLFKIQNSPPPELVSSGFRFNQTLDLDNIALAALRRRQGITNGSFPTVNIPSGPYAGLSATISPYTMTSTATQTATKAQVTLQRQINSYLIPLFQFGMFSDEDIELHPGPAFTFNGRVHANGNIYVNGNVTFLSKVTTANEFITDVLRNGSVRTGNVSMQVGSFSVPITMGSATGGPNFPGALNGERGFFPGSPNGNPSATWDSLSVGAAQSGVPNQFGGQLLTRTTGAVPLLLPMQLGGSQTLEVIKRPMPNDTQILSQSRYQNKAQIRILLDDESSSAADASGIPFGAGLPLSSFIPEPLPEGVALSAGGGRALWRIKDDGTYIDTTATAMLEDSTSGPQADTVRGVKAMPAPSPSPAPTPAPDYSSNGVAIPWGAGLSGRISIQVVDPDGITTHDVTKQVLSLGMTEGEPNGIVYLQRPLWAAFTQGSRDASGGNNSLTYFVNGPGTNINGTNVGISGRINTASVVQDGTYGYLMNLLEDTSQGGGIRKDSPGPTGDWNSIVPINVYNVREGRMSSALAGNMLYERGMTNVVEINMRNLARWVDGVFDANLLAGTNAVSTKIDGSNGYVVYISDRRGDKVKPEIDPAGVPLSTTNGRVDNEDIYGPNGALDPGEDAITDGIDLSTGLAKLLSLQKDQSELPDPNQLSAGFPLLVGGTISDRAVTAKSAAAWTNSNSYFRRAVRLFNGENLQTTGTTDRLSNVKGLTVATENMVYIWGNFNTTGINGQPPGGSTLNDPDQTYYYLGNQVPASIVADAFFPLSKTWFDSSSAMHPDELNKRLADLNLPSAGNETSVRAGIIAGNNLSALSGSPDAGNSGSGESRLNGGMHNFPRFLENWSGRRWNFVGALIPLYHSTQALGPYNADSTIYSPPIRNWAFDISFTDPSRLPPGTPSFEYVMPTGFRQVF